MSLYLLSAGDSNLFNHNGLTTLVSENDEILGIQTPGPRTLPESVPVLSSLLACVCIIDHEEVSKKTGSNTEDKAFDKPNAYDNLYFIIQFGDLHIREQITHLCGPQNDPA